MFILTLKLKEKCTVRGGRDRANLKLIKGDLHWGHIYVPAYLFSLFKNGQGMISNEEYLFNNMNSLLFIY